MKALKNFEQSFGDLILRTSQPWYAVVCKQTSPDGKLREVLALRVYEGEAENLCFLWSREESDKSYEVIPVMVTFTPGTAPKICRTKRGKTKDTSEETRNGVQRKRPGS